MMDGMKQLLVTVPVKQLLELHNFTPTMPEVLGIILVRKHPGE